MGYVGFSIMRVQDAQTPIWVVLGSGIGLALSIASYFFVWFVITLIRFIGKHAKRISSK